MDLTFAQKIQGAYDVTRKNTYKLKPYLLRDGKKHPFAVICPGGAYSLVCSFLEGMPYAKKLNELGYHAFVLYYHTKDKAKYPAPQEDLACAIREIGNNADKWNVEMDGYSVWGSSAGGHLAGSFGTESMGYAKYGLPKPGTIVLCYPVVTMGKLTHQETQENLLGKEPGEDMVRLASIEGQITPNYPPTFLWCGTDDKAVDPENSHMLAVQLERNGVIHCFREYAGVDHGVGLGEGLACEEWFNQAVAFWEHVCNLRTTSE